MLWNNSRTPELLLSIKKSQHIKIMKRGNISRIKNMIIIREMTTTEMEVQTIIKEDMPTKKMERNNNTIRARAMEE